MMNSSEKDKLNNSESTVEPKKKETPSDDSGSQSTIFVKHVYDTKKPAEKGSLKRVLVCVIAAVLCGAIIGSVFLVEKLLPTENSSSTNSVTEEEEFDILKFKDIVKPSYVTIKGEKEKVQVETNIESVSYVNVLDEFVCLPVYVKNKKEEDTSSATSSSTTSSSSKKTYLYDTQWHVDGLDSKLTMSDSIGLKIQDSLEIKGFREMENTFSSVEEYHKYYGITDSLNAGCIIKFNDGTETLTIKVGSSVAGGDAYYFVTSLSDTIYVVKAEYAEVFVCTTKTFAEPTILEAVTKTDSNKSYFNETTNKLGRFDSVKISGDVFGGKTYSFKMATGASADYMPYMMTAPYKRPADTTFLTSILNIANNGLEAIAMYSYTSTDKEKETYNLKNPKAVIEFKAGKYAYTLTIGGVVGKDADTQCMTVMVDGKKQIFGVAVDSFDFLIEASNDITKMFNPGFILEDLYSIKSFEMADKTGKYKFDLTHTLREGETKVYDTVVKKGSTVMNTKSFKLIYQRVLMLSLTEYVLEAERTEPVFSVKFNFIDGGSKLVEFTESPDDIYHYTAWLDGTPLGEVIKSTVTDIENCLEIYLSGGEVPDTWDKG